MTGRGPFDVPAIPLKAIGAHLAAAGRYIGRLVGHEQLASKLFENAKLSLQGLEKTLCDAAATISRITESTAKGDAQQLYEELRAALEATLRDLHTAFPPPASAPDHNSRKADVRRVLDAIFDTVINVVLKHTDIPEGDLRAVFGSVRDALEAAIVFTGVFCLCVTL
jgi:hypothetical protein